MTENVLVEGCVKISGQLVPLSRAQQVADYTSNVLDITVGEYRNPVGSTKVFGVRDGAGKERIVMFSIVAGLTREKLLRTATADRFGIYSVPAKEDLHVMEDFPRLPTGKVDIKLMRRMAVSF
jgi:hypothetical protein